MNIVHFGNLLTVCSENKQKLFGPYVRERIIYLDILLLVARDFRRIQFTRFFIRIDATEAK